MKKLIFILFFVICAKSFAQTYDVYLDPFLRTFPYIENGTEYYRTTRGTMLVRDANMNVLISINRTFETNNTGIFEWPGDIRSARTSSSSINFSGTFRVDTSPKSFNTSDSGSMSIGDWNSSLSMIFSYPAPSYNFEALINFAEEMNISVPNSTLCYDQDIQLTQNARGHPNQAYNWQFKGPLKDDDWASIPSSTGSPTGTKIVSLANLYTDSNELSKRMGKPIEFKIHNVLNDYDSNTVTYTWFDCPPEYDSFSTTNTTCAVGSTDGSITLNFLEDINPEFSMRYFIYQGEPSEFPSASSPDDQRPPDAYRNATLNSLVDNLDGTFSGSTGNILDPGEYYIVYQEVLYDPNDIDVTVTSGAITPTSFTVGNPTAVAINNVSITEPTCSTIATGSATVNVVALSGQDFEEGTYEYSNDDGANWQPSPTFENLAQGSPQKFRVKLVFSGGRECISADNESRTIDSVTNLLTINGGSGPVSPTTDSSNDGQLFIRVDGGAPEYTFELYNRLNPTVILQSTTVAIATFPNNEYRFEGLDEGTYFSIVKDANCDVTSQDYILEAALTPQLGLSTVTPISCNNANDATITVNATYGEPTTFFYELRIGATVVRDGNFASSTIAPYEEDITFSNLEAGNYSLFVRADLGDFSSIVIPEIINPEPITATISATPFSCFNSTDGALTVIATGATNYEYELSTDRGNWVELVGNNISVDNPNFYEVRLRNRDNPSCVSAVSNQEEVTRPLEITITEIIASHVDVSTNGVSNGALEILVENGTPGYIFSWTRSETLTSTKIPFTPPTPNSTDTNLVDLPFGFYQVTLTDDTNTCPSVLGPEIEITQPGPLDITDFIGSDTCNGLETGTITSTVQGTGNITFEFLLQPGEVGESVAYTITTTDRTVTAPNLGAGTYGLRITEVTSTAIQTTDPIDYVTISELPGITAETAKTDVSCDGFTQGTITVSNVIGGSPFISAPNDLTGYEYRINDTFNTFQAEPVFNNVAVGSYTLTVRDALGCEFNTLVEVVQNGVPVLDPVATIANDASSDTSLDGSVVLEFETGTDLGSLSFEWSGPGVSGITTKDLDGVGTGTYQVIITAPGNCTLPEIFTIGVEAAFSIQPLTGTPTLCSGGTDGSVTANITATGPVTFNWKEDDGGVDGILINTIENSALRTLSLNNLSTGIYYLEAIDENNVTIESNRYEIVELPEVSATIVPVPTCSGSNTGSITFIPSGTLTYFYSIDGGTTFQPEPVFENLADITYNLQVRATESPNCDYILSDVLIGVSSGMFWDEDYSLITRASGPGANDGSITAVVTGGTGFYTYSLNNGIPQPTNVFADLGKGTYSVTITDESGCSITQNNLEVTEVGPLTISNVTVTDASCQGEANGSIATTVTGEGTITYKWTLENGDPVPVSNGTDGANITGVLAGTYLLTAIDDNRTATITRIVGEPTTSVTITNIAITDVSCFGGTDGTLTITADGGTAPYMYSINGGDFQTELLFDGLSATGYTVSVRDANDCMFIEQTSTPIIEPQELGLALIDVRPVSLPNGEDGAISIDAEGGSGNYTYSWTGPDGYTSVNKDVLNGQAGDYVVTITDAINTGCSFTSDPIKITEPGELVVTIDQSVMLPCYEDDFAEITANVQGDAPFTYQWFEEINGNNTLLEEETNIIGGLSPGKYFLRATDANLLSVDSDPITITAPAQLEITIDSTNDIICAGEATGAISITVSGGTPPYQYSWSNLATVPDISGLEPGDYTIYVEDAAICIAERTVTISAPVDAIEITDVTISDASEYLAADGTISLDIIGGAEPYSYTWTRLSDNSNVGDRAAISNLMADSYVVLASDANGCSVTETYEVTQPDIVEGTIVQPICSGEANGSISVIANEGNGVFTYLWSTGATESQINNLPAGTYSVTVTGFDGGPIDRTYVLENPVPLEVDLGSDVVLCSGQTLQLDATVDDQTATYTWSSNTGFSSSEPNVELIATGNYTVTVESETGCTVEGTISVDISTDEINAEFAVSSQVFTGESVIAVDISYPLPDGIEWILPVQAKIETQNRDEAQFTFAEAGEYEITIITTRGECVAQKTKKIVVVARDGLITEEDTKNGQKLIENFLVYPNPSDGKFTADVTLTEEGNISIKVFSLANNALMASEKDRGELSYSIPFDLSGLPAGVYAVLLETPYGQTLRKVIIK
ncbi:T9SS type A sorting domain-containing protein [Zobellia nedashkovskayae]|uniref:T9SS type A sorting domain-containing protein n=1 Tax=Zobellia nedashkovskayae TaxID=2779510 RepID=UPI00188D2166|nr:T9SS type A sorting domain-containing protein [Zobellia nedashkovskayae]